MVTYQNRWLIRQFKPEDYTDVMNVWIETDLARPERADDLDTILRTIDKGGALLVMIDLENGKLIGTSWIANDGRRLHLQYFGILPAYQGKGLSHFLLKESLRFAKKLGMQIKLEVHKDNTVAKNLYEKWGFKRLDGYEIFILRDVEDLSL